jgi:predicted transposase YdaD
MRRWQSCARPDDIRQRGRRILARLAPLGRRERDDAAAKLLTLAQLRQAVPIVKEEGQTMAIQFNIHEHPFLSEIFDQGLAEGEAKGLAEGEVRGLSEALLRLIQRRHGPVSEALAQRLRAASVADLDRWLDAVLDAPDISAADLDVFLNPSRH